MRKRNKKQLIYLGSVCKVENHAGIFLSDVYVIKDGENYVNYFDNTEIFSTKYKEDGDKFISIMGSYKMNDQEIFRHMLYNPQYCKDRILQIRELFEKDKFVISNSDFERCKEVIQMDSLVHSRYDSCDSVTRYYVKQKIK